MDPFLFSPNTADSKEVTVNFVVEQINTVLYRLIVVNEC